MPNNAPTKGFLGRILNPRGEPVGTCFQVGNCEIVTAWHVVRDVGAERVGDAVTVDPLGGGSAIGGRVVATDPTHDLALLYIAAPPPDTVAGLGSSDGIDPETLVTITGAPEVDDVHQYRSIDAAGKWQGDVTRGDGTRLARLTSSSVMRGMSGAPVVRHSDRLVVGVVSGRYNSD